MAALPPTPQPRLPASLPASFIQKKTKILAVLAVPEQEYDDLSPKGSIDEGIRNLIDEINDVEGWVTTSSCAGRVSVFVEGEKRVKVSGEDGQVQEHDGEEAGGNAAEKKAAVGGKGGGGKWLFVSHEPVMISRPENDPVAMFGFREQDHSLNVNERSFAKGRMIHFKFEPMVRDYFLASG
jgi:tRNA wybutosine-synthesizing protein 3